jgi:hypothetical protein
MMVSYKGKPDRPYSARGFGGLSQTLGAEIWGDQILLHDDGLLGYGGTRTFGVGGQGSGKTTLNTKFARLSYYIDGMNKNDFIKQSHNLSDDYELRAFFNKHVHPETVLWRGREFDSWNVLVPSVFKTCYPNEQCKPLKVHIHSKSELEFYQQNTDTLELVPIEGIDIARYSNIAELYKNIVEGGNNIIYPPTKHFMSARLKDAINTKRNLNKNDRKYMLPEDDYLVERDVFLFEIFEYLYRANLESEKKKWFTSIIDESHDLFRANAPDVYYWIIECMVDVLVDTRKHNLSMCCMTHALNLIDYRILERASHFIWLRGAKPTSSYSTVDVRLVKKLLPGQGVNESCMDGKIGGFEFDRVPNNLSRLIVKGMAEDHKISQDLGADEFAESEDGNDMRDPRNRGGRPRRYPLPEVIEI